MNETNDYSQLVIDLIACYNGNCRPCSRNENPGDGGCVRIMKEAATAISDLETRLTHLRKQNEMLCGVGERLSSAGGSIFSQRLADLIAKAGISQRELAMKIGVTEVSMARYVSGKRIPGLVALTNLAQALHTSVGYLLGVEQEEPDPIAFLHRIGVLDENGNVTENFRDILTERRPDHAAADKAGSVRDPEDLHPDAGATSP